MSTMTKLKSGDFLKVQIEGREFSFIAIVDESSIALMPEGLLCISGKARNLSDSEKAGLLWVLLGEAKESGYNGAIEYKTVDVQGYEWPALNRETIEEIIIRR